MKVFITGGTGFIGRHLVRRMAKSEHVMYCLARKTSDTAELEKLGAKIVLGDVLNRDSLMNGMKGCDWLLNLANLFSFWEPEKSRYRNVNVIGTQNVLECALARGISKVVHISSIVVYGKPLESPFSEESPVGPVRFSHYAQSKYEGDLIAWKLFKEKGLPLVMIYPAAVIGSGDLGTAGKTIDLFLHHKLPATSFHKRVLTYVHVNDVAEAIFKAAEKPGNIGEKYIVGNAHMTFDEFFNMVSEVSGLSLPRMHLPDRLTLINAKILTTLADVTKRPPLWGMAIDAMRTYSEDLKADGSKAERELGITYTPIRKAFEEEIEWYRNPSHSHFRS